MYAGGGFLGGANGLQLVQSTTDKALFGQLLNTVVSGSGFNYYAFLIVLILEVTGEPKINI